MCLIVLFQPSVEIVLRLLQGRIELFAKGYAVEFILHGAMEAFTDAVGLRRLGSSSAVIDIFHGQIQLIFVMLTLPAVLGSAIGQNAQPWNLLLFEEGQNMIVQQVGATSAFLRSYSLAKATFV